MALVPYSGCIFSSADGLGWLTETAGANAGLPVLERSFSPPSGVATGSGVVTTPPGATIVQGAAIVLASATVTSPAAAFDTSGYVWANVPPLDVQIDASHQVDINLDLKISFTIGATTSTLDPARRWSWDATTMGPWTNWVDLGFARSASAAVAAGQTITATAQLRLWGTWTAGANLGVFGASSIAVGWEGH